MNEQFEIVKKDLDSILMDLNPIILNDPENGEEVDDTILFLVNDEVANSLIILKDRLESEFETGSKEALKYSFTKLVKFINPGEPVNYYYTKFEVKSKYITDKVKVKDRLDEEFEVWANTYRKYSIKEMKKNGKMSPDDIKTQENDIDAKIEDRRATLEYIKENYNSLEVRISAKERANSYGTIYYKGSSNKHKHKHLSNKIPNVFHYIKPEFGPRDDRSEFMKEAISAFGDVYFIDKQ